MAHNIQALPTEERPRERLVAKGPKALSTSELLAIILGSGMQGKSVLHLAQELLAHFGGLKGILNASLEDLKEVKGMGQAKAIQLKAALSLSSRLVAQKDPVQQPIKTAQQAYAYIKEHLAYEKKEVFGAILLDTRGLPIRWEVISVGTRTQTLVHPRELFAAAIDVRATSMIIVHNHPSGDPSPSKEDLALTQKLQQLGQLMQIPILDHLIVGQNGYQSAVTPIAT